MKMETRLVKRNFSTAGLPLLSHFCVLFIIIIIIYIIKQVCNSSSGLNIKFLFRITRIREEYVNSKIFCDFSLIFLAERAHSRKLQTTLHKKRT